MWHRKFKGHLRSAQGGINISNILGLAIVAVIVTAVLWAARIVLVELELQNTVSAATTAVSSAGCWDSKAQSAWSNGIKLWPLALGRNTVKLDSSTTQTYQSYGKIVTVSASLPITIWGTLGSPGGTLTLQSTRKEFSTAPTIQTTACDPLPID